MSRRSLIPAAAAVVLASCAPPTPVAISPPSAAAVAEVERACEELGEVDLARLADLKPNWERFERFHAVARQGLEPMPAVTSDIIAKLAIPGESIAAPYGTSVFAVLQRGRWLVSHVRVRQLAPPPQPPGSPPSPAGPQRIVTNGVLKADAADRLNAAIASECYRNEPLLSPAALPLRDGEVSHCPPDAGQPNALELIQNGNSRRYLRECGRAWATGVMIIALENPQNIIPAP